MIKHIVFDLGGVLIDWNPRYLYRKIFEKEEEMEYFLQEVCHMEWNEMQDGGRGFQEGIAERIVQFPNYAEPIQAYFSRWTEMLGGPIDGSVKILGELVKQGKHNLFAITNWSHETYPFAKSRYAFLSCFQDVVISGVEKLKKPDPRIYKILFDRQQIAPEECVFIDDNRRNIEAASQVGMQVIHYMSSEQLRKDLSSILI